jgi:hypothetical protein
MPIKMMGDCIATLNRSDTNGNCNMYIIKMCTFQDNAYGNMGQN